MKSFSLASLAALALACGGAIADDATPPPPLADAAPPDVAPAQPDAAAPDDGACLPAKQVCPKETVCRVVDPTTNLIVADVSCASDAGPAWSYYLASYPATPSPVLACSNINPQSATCPPNDTCALLDGSLGYCVTK